MSGHTPGPWRETVSLTYGGEVSGLSPKGKPIVVARVPMPRRDPEERKANTRLIAAAPELLEAANAGRAYFQAMAQSTECDPGKIVEFSAAEGKTLDALFERWVELSTAAIAKAGGKP